MLCSCSHIAVCQERMVVMTMSSCPLQGNRSCAAFASCQFKDNLLARASLKETVSYVSNVQFAADSHLHETSSLPSLTEHHKTAPWYVHWWRWVHLCTNLQLNTSQVCAEKPPAEASWQQLAPSSKLSTVDGCDQLSWYSREAGSIDLRLSPSIQEVHTHQRKYSEDEPNDNQHP